MSFRSSFSCRKASLVLLLLIGGCLTINLNKAPPSDWPLLNITVYEAPLEYIERRCSNVTSPVGCAVVDFNKSTCSIFVFPNAPEWLIEHETYHCLGYDHYGESTMVDAWKDFHDNSR